jgi:hypothetical protein
MQEDNQFEAPYSYHTFLLPFNWNDNGKTKIDDFRSNFLCSNSSTDCYWKDITGNKGKPRIEDFKAYSEQYNIRIKFTSPAVKVIFGGDTNIVTKLELQNSFLMKYRIKKNDKLFELNINAICLDIYNTGIAIFSIELENIRHRNIEDVILINEYGRHINFPYLPIQGEIKGVADIVEIQISETIVFKENFKERFEFFRNGDTHQDKELSSYYLPLFIKGTLNLNVQHPLVSLWTDRTNDSYLVCPCVTEMFIHSLIGDEKLDSKIKDFYSNVDTETNNDFKKLIYSLILIEKNDEKTIYSNNLDNHIVFSAISNFEKKKLYAFSPFASICLSGDKLRAAKDRKRTTFLGNYLYLFMIAILQMTTILDFASQASVISCDLNLPNRDVLRELELLQRKYVRFQNQIMIFEPSLDEQSNLIFDLIREQLEIEKNSNYLEVQLNNLNNTASAIADNLALEHDKKLNNILLVFTIISLIFAAPSFFDYFGGRVAFIVTFFTATTLSMILLLWRLLNQRKIRRILK